MLADLKEYRPANIDFVLDDKAKEEFKDVMVLCKGAKSSKEVLKVFREKFNCLKEENDVPKRKQELQETLEAIKAMKKNAEEAYNSILLEIADLAARVKEGTTDIKLSSTETVRIALNGYFLFYSWVDGEMKLVKTQKIPDWDRGGLWSQEDVNREAMKELFGIEFPEVEKPAMNESGAQEEDDDLPFGDED